MSSSGKSHYLILLLFFLSGVAALSYEILWLRELGLLFGNASYAMATTLTVFFMGLALGNQIFGKMVSRNQQPLKLYGWLEMGVAIFAVSYFVISAVYADIYPILFGWFGSDRYLFTTAKFVLALTLLLPPALLMGGTFPVISHYSVDKLHPLGLTVSLLYFVNTLGAVMGALLAGIFLPPWLGYSGSYYLALFITISVALIALFISRQTTSRFNKTASVSIGADGGTTDIIQLKALAFVSGLAMLGLQVLWNRMFAQVLQNSVYTFSLILVIFLAFLALGSGLANRLMLFFKNDRALLFLLLTTGGILVTSTPFIFNARTDHLIMLITDQGWQHYLFRVSLLIGLVIGPPLLFLGGVFPMLIKLGDKQPLATGKWIGVLTSYNTWGAIVGSLTAGFVILDTIGLWAGIRLLAVLLLMAAGYTAMHSSISNTRWIIFPAFAIFLSLSFLDTSKLPIVQVDPINEDESLLQSWEGSAANVAVIRQLDQLKLKVNNHYTLGGSGSYELEQFEGYLPLLLHTNPKSVYCLGLGTGITAGAVLDYPIQKLVVTEIIPEVITAADNYFYRYTNRLFYDSRVNMVQEDGRNYLRGTRQRFDVIISDLFIPWKAGVGGLYSQEHYQNVKQRLTKNGLFMQWLPTYQLSQQEFYIIANTLLSVFPQITVWRGDFSSNKPIIGLLGQRERKPLSKNAWLFKENHHKNAQQPVLSHYVGALKQSKPEFINLPINTDKHPLIEFQSPITQLHSKKGSKNWMTGATLLKFMQALQSIEPSADPFIIELAKRDKNLPVAGLYLHQSRINQNEGQLKAAKSAFERYRLLLKTSN